MRHFAWGFLLSLAVCATAGAQRVNFSLAGGLASHYGGSTRSVGAFRAGASYEYELPGNFSIEPGAYFYAKGYKDRNESVYLRDADGKIILDDAGNSRTGVKNVSTGKYYVEVPVMANYYLAVAPLHYIEFSAGPYAAVGVGGKRKTRGDTEQEGASRYFYEKSTFKEKGAHRFDCGLAAGVAYEFNRMFAVGVVADFGLLNFRGGAGKNVSGVVSFSYRLRLDD